MRSCCVVIPSQLSWDKNGIPLLTFKEFKEDDAAGNDENWVVPVIDMYVATLNLLKKSLAMKDSGKEFVNKWEVSMNFVSINKGVGCHITYMYPVSETKDMLDKEDN